MYESFDLLNEYQRNAVKSDDKYLLLNACVGSGKTTVLANKVLYLFQVKKVKLSDMVVFTFTNKAAGEIKERVISLAKDGINSDDLNFFGTFHSVARQLLSTVLPVEGLGFTKNFTVIDRNELEELYESVINEHKLDIKYKKRIDKRVEYYRRGKLLYGNMKNEDEIDKLIDIIREEKIKRNVMDFDDLIENAVKLLKYGDFKPLWVIVDEFQDTDGYQLEMIDGLVGCDTHIFAVGDPNQIIYSWRGSSSNIFEIFKQKYNAKVMSLPVNYRSTSTIIKAAREFMNSPYSLEGSREEGAPIVIKRHYNAFNEALYLADVIKKLHQGGNSYSDIAVFYRKQKQSAVFEDVFKKEAIPYEVSVKKTVRDIPPLYWMIRLLKASYNNRDTDSMLYVVRDNMYGLNLTSKKEASIIKDMSRGEKSSLPQLVQKMLYFKEWCRYLIVDETFGSRVYDYFDIDSYISPTSIYYSEDRKIILKYLDDVGYYIKMNNLTTFDGIGKAVNDAALYGSSMTDEFMQCEDECVKLMTLHASKGLEFKYVFISGANSGIIPLGRRFDDEEEKRLFFVGITRAKDYLEISYHSNPEDYNALPVPSPYISMIPDELIKSDEFKSRASRLSELRKLIKESMDKSKEVENKKKVAVMHDKYGIGYITYEDDETYRVEFEGYGEKTFSKMFCPLKFIE